MKKPESTTPLALAEYLSHGLTPVTEESWCFCRKCGFQARRKPDDPYVPGQMWEEHAEHHVRWMFDTGILKREEWVKPNQPAALKAIPPKG